MFFKLLRYVTLFLILLNFPGWVLEYINPVYASILSYLSYALMLAYFFLARKGSLNLWMLLLGVLYFGIGSLSNQSYIQQEVTYLILIIKYFITVMGGYEILKDTSKKELFFFLLIGSLTVFLQIFIFFDPLKDYGRYSGFYLNPNSLGFICMMGYGLTYGLDKKWKILGQVAFTLIGFLTVSRTFIIVWLIMNLFSLRLSFKNIRILAIGVFLFLGLLTYNEFLPKKDVRLMAMSNILEGKSTSTKKLQQGGRSATWAMFYPALMDKPLFGNGYNAFEGGGVVKEVGVHNAYLKIIGDSGIFPFFIFLIIILTMIKKSYSNFLKHPYLLMMTVALLLFLATNHNYFESGYMLFFTMWLQYHIKTVENNFDLETNNKQLAN